MIEKAYFGFFVKSDQNIHITVRTIFPSGTSR